MINMIKQLIAKNLSLPLFDAAKGTAVAAFYRRYRNLLHRPIEEVRNFQLEKLKQIVRHAQTNIPFYKQKFKEYGVSADTLKTLEDLKKFPFLTRQDIQDHLPELTPEGMDLSGIYKGSSSGSTGKPISYYIEKNSQSAGRAAMYLGWQLAGWKLGQKGIHIWGNPRVVKEQWTKKSSKLKDILFNHYKYPAYKLTEGKEFDNLIQRLQKENYYFVDGYTTAIYLLARYIEDNNIKLNKYRFVLTTAETLQDYQREIIQRNLGPVYDGYGCSEIEGIANQCRLCGNYHIIEPRVIVEYDHQAKNLDGSLPIIVTELDNSVMPFIRYKIGDLAVPADSNQCPVQFTAIKSISGRTSDIISIPGGGNLVVASFFGAALLKKLDKKINQYQVEKIAPDKIILKLAVTENYGPTDEAVIRDYLDDYLAGKIQCDIKPVDQIPVSKNGKFKLLVDNT
jgi:phenylacetate-CoA ligase